MLPSSVSKCMTTNYDAIIYDHDHSKHISDHLRCRQDNGATCLNCKVDVFLEMQTTASLFSLLSFTPPPLLLKCKQLGSVTRSSAHLPFTLPVLTHPLSISPYLSLALSGESFTVPWYDQRQLCDTVRGIQEAENIKLLKSNSQKRQTQRDGGAGARVCVCMCVINI